MKQNNEVLIIDDDPWLAEHIVRVLAGAGICSSVAPDSLVAMERLEDRIPSAMIIDLFLPAVNGLALIHELRSHGDLAQVPLIVCTSSAETVTVDMLRPYGVACLLDKTVMTPRDIIAAVRRIM